MLSAKRPAPGAVELPFEPVGEGWSVYRVKEDDTTVKVKLILLKVFLEGLDEVGYPSFGAATNVSITATAPPKLKGPVSNVRYSMKDIVDAMVVQDMAFEVEREDWNEYKLPDEVLIGIKPVVTMISRTSLYDGQGDPIYHVQNQAIYKGKVSKEARQKYAARLQSVTY